MLLPFCVYDVSLSPSIYGPSRRGSFSFDGLCSSSFCVHDVSLPPFPRLMPQQEEGLSLVLVYSPRLSVFTLCPPFHIPAGVGSFSRVGLHSPPFCVHDVSLSPSRRGSFSLDGLCSRSFCVRDVSHSSPVSGPSRPSSWRMCHVIMPAAGPRVGPSGSIRTLALWAGLPPWQPSSTSTRT